MKNYGFIAPEIVKEDYRTFGATSLPKEILQENMDWREFIPVFEHQRRYNLETQGCVSFGENSACEMINKRKYKVEPNYSDRFLATQSETTRNGNSPKKVAEAARKKGLVKEASWPWESHIKTWDDYYSAIPNGVSQEGLEWLGEHTFGYEWVFTGGTPITKHQSLKRALKMGPIGVSVFAWTQNSKGEYAKPTFASDNHWVILIAYDEQDRPIIFDSYEENLKTLEKNYDFGFAMRYFLEKKPSQEKQVIDAYNKRGFWGKWKLFNWMKC